VITTSKIADAPMARKVRGLSSLCLLCAAAAAQVATDPLIGTWRGAINVGVAELELALHLTVDQGAYSATLDSVTQGARDIPVASITREGGHITARLPAIGAEYVATLIETKLTVGRQLKGVWKQGGRDFPLVMTPGSARAPRRPQHPSDKTPYRSVSVMFGHDPERPLDESFEVGAGADVSLAGTLTLPVGDGPHPVAVMITGSGPQDRDETLCGHKPFLVIADHLTRNGIAILRYDDRGTAASTGDFASATTRDFAVDVRAALRFLKTRDDIDHGRMGLIGHSEGGLVAPMVASGSDADLVSFAVLLAAPAVKIGDIITHQSELIGLAEGTEPEHVHLNVDMIRAALAAVIANRDDPAGRVAAIRAVAAQHWSRLPAGARARMPSGVEDLAADLARLNTPWMNWLVHYDPAPALRDMKCRALAVFGGNDLQVDPAQNRPPLEVALAGRASPTEIVTIEGVNHLFQQSETGRPTEYGKLEETFAPQALQLIQAWLAEQTQR